MRAPWVRHGEAPGPTDLAVADRALLISIQPRFAKAILEGTKTIELRRTMPTLPPQARALIYASSPTKAVVGWATIDGVLRATPQELWRTQKDSTGVTEAEFDEYFAGRDDAFGYQLANVERAASPISLAKLREHALEPPQSWRYVPARLAESLCQVMVAPSGTRNTTASVPPVLAGVL
jgi:predicted transcriptional regulator